MTSMWNKGGPPTRHEDPDEAIAQYLDQIHQADVADAEPPASALNGLGDAYLDKGDVGSAVEYYRQAAEAYAREGMHGNAIACCKKVRRQAIDEGDVGLLLGRYYAAKGLRADALDELEAYIEGRGRANDRRGSIEGYEELLRIAPERTSGRERLAGLYRDDGQRDAAVEAYRAALAGYVDAGQSEEADRVRDVLNELDSTPAAPEATGDETPSAESGNTGADEARTDTAVPGDPGPLIQPTAHTPPPAVEQTEPRIDPADEPDPSGPDARAAEPESAGFDLEIETTSYEIPPREAHPPGTSGAGDRSGALEGAADADIDPGSGGETSRTVPEGETPVAESDGPEEDEAAAGSLDKVSSLEEAMAELEAVDRWQDELDTRLEEVADEDTRADILRSTAAQLSERKRWEDAVTVHRRLAKRGGMTGEDFETWTESARQAGRAADVLEALAAHARWRLDREDPAGARRTAEEMLLVDPDNVTAARILEQAGSALPE